MTSAFRWGWGTPGAGACRLNAVSRALKSSVVVNRPFIGAIVSEPVAENSLMNLSSPRFTRVWKKKPPALPGVPTLVLATSVRNSWVASVLAIENSEKQQLLEIERTDLRLQRELGILGRENGTLQTFLYLKKRGQEQPSDENPLLRRISKN